MLNGVRILAISVATVLTGSAGPLSAQSAHACGDALLFQCTFDSAAKRVALCRTDDIVTYRFGSNLDTPELALESTIGETGFLPGGEWGANFAFSENIRMRNGDTSYDVFATRSHARNEYPLTTGGIVVAFPNGSSETLTCDPYSVNPESPIRGIGQLAAFVEGDADQILQRCRDERSTALACLGVVTAVATARDGCNPGSDFSACWTAERAAWDSALETETGLALEALKTLPNATSAAEVQAAQDSWFITRNRDCKIYWPLVFAPDGGEQKCLAEYAAKRIDFLRDVVSGAEFDG